MCDFYLRFVLSGMNVADRDCIAVLIINWFWNDMPVVCLSLVYVLSHVSKCACWPARNSWAGASTHETRFIHPSDTPCHIGVLQHLGCLAFWSIGRLGEMSSALKRGNSYNEENSLRWNCAAAVLHPWTVPFRVWVIDSCRLTGHSVIDKLSLIRPTRQSRSLVRVGDIASGLAWQPSPAPLLF